MHTADANGSPYCRLKDEHLERLKLAKGTGVGGEGTSVGSGQGRGSMQVGLAQSNAADKQVRCVAHRVQTNRASSSYTKP